MFCSIARISLVVTSTQKRPSKLPLVHLSTEEADGLVHRATPTLCSEKTSLLTKEQQSPQLAGRFVGCGPGPI